MAKLLIVDDEPDIHQLIRRFAEHEGHETMVAASGLEAVALCREIDFDIVIMDVMMPDMDGFAACQEIRKDKDVPVLSVSTDGRVGYVLENGTTYVYGMILSASGTSSGLPGGNEAVLYISIPLGAVGAAVSILRIQLVWVTLASFINAFVIAYFISRRFAQPVLSISEQAGRMADGDFSGNFETGFCQELDELSDTLKQTAEALARA